METFKIKQRIEELKSNSDFDHSLDNIFDACAISKKELLSVANDILPHLHAGDIIPTTSEIIEDAIIAIKIHFNDTTPVSKQERMLGLMIESIIAAIDKPRHSIISSMSKDPGLLSIIKDLVDKGEIPSFKEFLQKTGKDKQFKDFMSSHSREDCEACEAKELCPEYNETEKISNNASLDGIPYIPFGKTGQA